MRQSAALPDSGQYGYSAVDRPRRDRVWPRLGGTGPPTQRPVIDRIGLAPHECSRCPAATAVYRRDLEGNRSSTDPLPSTAHAHAPAARQQLLVPAAIGTAAGIAHNDLVHVQHRREAMSSHDRVPVLRQPRGIGWKMPAARIQRRGGARRRGSLGQARNVSKCIVVQSFLGLPVFRALGCCGNSCMPVAEIRLSQPPDSSVWLRLARVDAAASCRQSVRQFTQAL